VIDLICKRHPAPGWVVIQECGNGTGYNTKRHADAVALGIWPSHGHAVHGFECKASRGDLMRELDDPSKADPVGQYCDYWWLVVEELKLLDTVVVPETWGVLYPKAGVLRVHKKAPKREAKPVTRGFAAAMIRKVVEQWVPKHEHEAFKNNARDELRKELEQERKYAKDSDKVELNRLRDLVDRFEEHSGVKLVERYDDGNGGQSFSPKYDVGHIADAVAVVVKAREQARYFGHDRNEPAELVRQEIAGIDRVIENHENALRHRKAARDNLEAMLKKIEGEKPTQLTLVPEST
jgi:hypothetical protein